MGPYQASAGHPAKKESTKKGQNRIYKKRKKNYKRTTTKKDKTKSTKNRTKQNLQKEQRCFGTKLDSKEWVAVVKQPSAPPSSPLRPSVPYHRPYLVPTWPHPGHTIITTCPHHPHGQSTPSTAQSPLQKCAPASRAIQQPKTPTATRFPLLRSFWCTPLSSTPSNPRANRHRQLHVFRCSVERTDSQMYLAAIPGSPTLVTCHLAPTWPQGVTVGTPSPVLITPKDKHRCLLPSLRCSCTPLSPSLPQPPDTPPPPATSSRLPWCTPPSPVT